MSSSPSNSNSDKTFTVDPSDNLLYSTSYKIRVTTGVKDASGNTMSSQYETSSGFTSSKLFVIVVTVVLSIASEKVTEMLSLIETPLWLSVGETEETVGGVVSSPVPV